MHVVIAYDVAQDRRRQAVVRALEDVGDRVQFSVFEAVLDAGLLESTLRRLAALIEPNEDSVRVYPLCEACRRRMKTLGRNIEVGGEEAFIV